MLWCGSVAAGNALRHQRRSSILIQARVRQQRDQGILTAARGAARTIEAHVRGLLGLAALRVVPRVARVPPLERADGHVLGAVARRHGRRRRRARLGPQRLRVLSARPLRL